MFCKQSSVHIIRQENGVIFLLVIYVYTWNLRMRLYSISRLHEEWHSTINSSLLFLFLYLSRYFLKSLMWDYWCNFPLFINFCLLPFWNLEVDLSCQGTVIVLLLFLLLFLLFCFVFLLFSFHNSSQHYLKLRLTTFFKVNFS